MKKTLAILLSLALVICMIPATAFGTTTTIPEGYSVDSVSIEPIATQTYTGSEIKPAIVVKATCKKAGSEDQVITLTTDDYTPTWSNNTAAGKATVNVIENLTKQGEAKTAQADFEIQKLDLSSAIIDTSYGMYPSDITENNLKSIFPVKVGNVTVGSSLYTISIEKINNNTQAKVTIQAISDDNVTGSKVATYVIKTDITGYIVDAIPDQTYTGNAISPSITVRPSSGAAPLSPSNYTVDWTSNVNAGVAYGTVQGTGNYKGTISQQVQFSILPKSIAGFSLTADDQVYTGSAVTTNVSLTNGSTVLKKDIDFEIESYVNNTEVGTNTAKVIIKGIGNYTGELSKTFSIVKAENSIGTATVLIGTTDVDNYRCYYNGRAQQPAVTVYLNNQQLSPSYYTVTYSNNTAVGPATVKITGRNGYGGSVTKTFQILSTEMNQFNTTISGFSSSYPYTGLYVTPTITVSVNGYTLTSGKDYTVSYENNRNISTSYSKAKIIVKAVAGSGYTGSATAEFTIAGKSIAGCNAYFTDGRSTAAYTGSVIKPSITVKDGYYTVLKEFTDYTVSYKNSAGKIVTSLKDAGTYTVVITGKGNYSGEISPLTFTITGTDISGYTVTLKDASVNATGYAQTPVITSVKKGYYYSLTSNDYTVTYQDSTGKTVTSMSAPGTYKVVVTGKNGYSGSTYATFRIVGLPQTVTVNQNSYKVYATSDSFKITAKASGDATGFTYTSSNPAVASVSSTGYVTMHKVGRAVITVTTTGMKKYEPASETVEVKVYPKKGYITKKPWTDGKKYQAKVRWTYQDGATKYQIRYSRDKNFKAGTYLTKTVNAHGKDYTTQSTTLTKLKRGYTYYVKVRAVYTDPVTGDNYYGSWSGWRSAKTI